MKRLLAALLLASLAIALNPEQTASHEGITVKWRENHCEGFGPGDCSVREPKTAHVVVYFPSGEARVRVRCRTNGCKADEKEIAEWVERARAQR